MAAEKEGYVDNVDVDYEKHAAPTQLDAARRESVAMNIVENPLKVSLTRSYLCRYHVPSISQANFGTPKRKTKQHVIDDAHTYAHSHGLSEHADLFGRGALVARDPEQFETIQELDGQEQAALAYERDHKWSGPFMLWYSISLCAVGAATQGWDQTGANGANLSFPQEFGIAGDGADSWKLGLVNAVIFLSAGLMSVPFPPFSCRMLPSSSA